MRTVPALHRPLTGAARRAWLGVAVPLLMGLQACDQLEKLGVETPAIEHQRREAEGKAIGGACRHVGRSIEQCYLNNKKADKAAMYAGWREMNEYMKENKLDAMEPPPEPVKPAPPPPKPASEAEGESEDEGDKAGKTAKAGKADKSH